MDEAVNNLNNEYDLIACSVHFDNGQFYDFLRIAKAHPKARNTPFLVVHTGKESYSQYIAQSVEIASRAQGAAAVIPITEWREKLGDEVAFKKYREIIFSLIIK